MSKTVLITGASTGIGRATAEFFQAKGWNVAATMRNPDAGADLAGPANMLVTRLDVTDDTSINEAVSAAIAKFGSIDALVNNAGYGAYGPLEAFSMDRIRRQFDTNVIGLLAVTKAVLPHMRAQKSGTIVNISSVGGKLAFPLGALYHGTKFAVEGISEALAFELDQIGVAMKIIEPGFVRTDFGGRSFDFANDENLAEYQLIVGNTMQAFQAAQEQGGAEPAEAAGVIYGAITDGSNQLRYTVGEDFSVQMVRARKTQDDETYIASVKSVAGL